MGLRMQVAVEVTCIFAEHVVGLWLVSSVDIFVAGDKAATVYQSI